MFTELAKLSQSHAVSVMKSGLRPRQPHSRTHKSDNWTLLPVRMHDGAQVWVLLFVENLVPGPLGKALHNCEPPFL